MRLRPSALATRRKWYCRQGATALGSPRSRACEDDKRVHYLTLDKDDRKSTDAAVRAGACGECTLVDEQGYHRSRPNFLLHPGSSG